MSEILFECILILLLLVANGVFAMTEIAMVSARKTRLKALADSGDARASLALNLSESPNRLLSTVQIGITLVGIFAGAFGGVTIAGYIAEALKDLPVVGPYARPIGLFCVVLAITYLSLVIGELVPKRIGLAYPEGISMTMARPMNALSVLAGPAIKLLGVSTDALLRIFGTTATRTVTVNEQEVQALMQEGVRAGAFNKVETLIVRGALELDQLTARDLMTPRPKIIWLNKSDSHEAIWHKIVVSGHTHFPVYEGSRDNVVGTVSLKAIYAHLAAGIPIRLADLMTTPLVVPDSQNAVQLLETFKQSGKHFALVIDEFGSILGLVTLHDIMEALIGEFPSREERAKPRMKKREDNTWLADAIIDIDQVDAALPGFKAAEVAGKDYQTLAGFIIKQLGHVPHEGETLHWKDFTLEVLDMDHHRVDKVLITAGPAKPHETAEPSI
ncbi:MAG TPA: hemolysin family protein [Clostridia bacterium]|nr:hemolysin family protein [Clostridia bacterium]